MTNPMRSPLKAARHLLGATAAACCLLAASSAQAALTFSFNFQGDFVGNTAAQQAVVTAGNLFSNMFATHFTNSAALTYDVTTYDGFAAAGSAGIAAPGFGNGEVIRNKVVNGIDLNLAESDGFIFINLAAPLILDPSAPVDFGAGQIDFFSVMFHELTHSLGFGSNINAAGDTPAAYAKWDQYLTSRSGVSLVDPITGLVNQAALLDAQANGGLFVGLAANAAFAGGVPLVASDDISHLNTDVFTVPNASQNALMLCCGNPNSPDQSEPREYNASEIGILTDLGYTRVAEVPEPSSIALMALGLAFVGVSARRRKS